jgi:hypothetical protein
MDEITTIVTSIGTLAPYKVSDDLMIELVSVTATVEHHPEGAALGTQWVQVVEPIKLIKCQPYGGYMLDNGQVQLTCSKSARVRMGDRIKFRPIPA